MNDQEDFANRIESAARELQKPAGESDKFTSLDSIQLNRAEFMLRCHTTWKKWHQASIEEILTFDAIAKAEKKNPVGHGLMDWVNYTRAIWRKVNDTIIWSLAGRQRHVVKRLCLYRQRGHLSESNASSTLQVLARLNSNPWGVAVWNDATSCVDVGDVTYLEAAPQPNLYFLELKEGEANREVAELGRITNPEEYQQKHSAFLQKYGDAGLKQLERFQRQEMRDNQMMNLLRNDQGHDPVTGHDIEVLDISSVDVKHYDDVLREVLSEVLDGPNESWRLVENCLWIYANSDTSLNPYEVRDKFRQILSQNDPRLRHLNTKAWPTWEAHRIATLNEGLQLPMALPLFLRGIEPRMIKEIAAGVLQFRVLLYLDWEKLGHLFQGEGGEFLWSSEKEARRAKSRPLPNQLPIVNGRVPQYKYGPMKSAITGSNLIQILFDGLTPSSFVKLAMETSRRLVERSDSK